jgi:hypothetical protein
MLQLPMYSMYWKQEYTLNSYELVHILAPHK